MTKPNRGPIIEFQQNKQTKSISNSFPAASQLKIKIKTNTQ